MIVAALASSGLVLDIIGVVFVWKFGLPESIHRGGVQHLLLEQIDEEQAARAWLHFTGSGFDGCLVVTCTASSSSSA